MNFLFGIPYYKEKIDYTLFNKKKIIEDIEENYKRSSYRSKWKYYDDMHHSFNDDNNSEFIKLDYSELIPLYNEHISIFLNEIPSLKKWEYTWSIQNYTATTNNQCMESHHHLPSLFHAIHYLKFDPEKHQPTIYKNSHDFSKYFTSIYPNIDTIFDLNNIKNSWMSEKYFLTTEEDDFIILPSAVFHEIRKSCSDSLRMTIVMNIEVDKSYIL